MPNLYMRRTALTNVAGRIDYTERRQRKYKDKLEDLLASYDGAGDLLGGRYWEQLSKEAQEAWALYQPENLQRINRKTGKPKKLKPREAQELVIQLPNDALQRLQPAQICRILADSWQAYAGRPAHVALHWNHDRTNLHAHLIYSERELLGEPVSKVAPRNLFFDETGRRCYKKAEILDGTGELRPGCRIVRKGEIYSSKAFGPVDAKLGSRAWLAAAKTQWLLPLLNGPLHGDVLYTEYDPASGKLPQIHKDPGLNDAALAEVEEQNERIKEYNRAIEERRISWEISQRYQQELARHKEQASILRMTIDMIRMVASKGEYVPDWIQDDQVTSKATISFDCDRALQVQMDALRVAREQDCSAEEAMELMRMQAGRELAAAKAAGEREAQRAAARRYAGIKKGQQKVAAMRSFDDLVGDANRRHQEQVDRAKKNGMWQPPSGFDNR